MKIYLALLTVLCLGLSCSKKTGDKEVAKSNLLDYKSEIPYAYKPFTDPEHAARVNDQPILFSQLLGQDVALRELQSSYDSQALVFAYAWAKMLAEKKAGVIDLKLLSTQPEKDLEEVLAKEGIEKTAQVQVEFIDDRSIEVLAKAGQQQLKWDEFHRVNVRHSRLYDKLFRQRLQILNGMVIRRFLLQAAKKENIPMQIYVRDKIHKKDIDPSEEEVRAFAKDKGISESDLNEKMVERLKDIVRQNYRDSKIETYVAKNLVKEPIAVSFRGPEFVLKAPKLNGAIPQWGKSDKTQLFYVGHWSCESCKDTLKSFLEMRKTWSHNVKGAFVYYFPNRDREARMGAEAAFCVKEQKEDYFWEFLEQMLTASGDNVEETLNQAAQSTGADFDKFRDCFLKRNHQANVETHLNYAQTMGIHSAPLILLKGEVIKPPVSIGDLNAMIDKMVPKKKSFFSRMLAFFGF